MPRGVPDAAVGGNGGAPAGGGGSVGGTGGTPGGSGGGFGASGGTTGGGGGGPVGSDGGEGGTSGNDAGQSGSAGNTSVDAMEVGPADRGGDGAMSWPVSDPGTMGDGNITIQAPFVIQPDLTDKGAQKGKSFHLTMPLAESMIFKGDDTTLDPVKRRSNTVNRNIDVYVPAKYQDGTPAALLIIHDGKGQFDLVARALDNLTISTDPMRKLPPFVIVAVQNGGGDAPGSERSLEYDTMSDRYARFIQLEVLPKVASDPNLRAAYPQFSFTDNPEGRGALGCSSGGAATLTMGWFRPEWFRRLISYSGSFQDLQDTDQPEEKLFPMGAAEYHSGQMLIAHTPRKPFRIFTNVNENEGGRVPNEKTAAALQAAGYHNRFVYGKGAGHCQGDVQQASLADALVWTWRGYPAN